MGARIVMSGFPPASKSIDGKKLAAIPAINTAQTMNDTLPAKDRNKRVLYLVFQKSSRYI
jgi:hypothetical protein